MSLCEHKSYSLAICINQVNNLLGFIHTNMSSLFKYRELYVTGGAFERR